MPGDYLRDLAGYWRDGYSWRAEEARLNAIPQFVTSIDGQRVHFAHIRSAEPDATPLLMIHGWPSSPFEYQDVIESLTTPPDPFHLVLPSLPGTGLSGPTASPGWNLRRIANLFATLMRRLGYERYGVQGGDWGAKIAREIGLTEPVIGVHANGTLGTPVSRIDQDTLTEAERRRLDDAQRFRVSRTGYALMQGQRPYTLAAALVDSPAGMLAWHADVFEWFGDAVGSLSRDFRLTSVMLYWLNGCVARLYHDAEDNAWSEAQEVSDTPTGVAVFPTDTSIRAFAERENKIVHWSEFDRGGHFAAAQAPDEFTSDVREFFRALR